MRGIALAVAEVPIQASFQGTTEMAAARTGTLKAIRFLLLSASILVGVSGTAHASLLTLNFSGVMDMSASGGAANTPFSGFFSWDTTQTPVPGGGDANSELYEFASYQLIFNGVNKTLGPGNSGMYVVNDGDPLSNGTNVDALLFLAVIDKNAVIGDTLFVAGFTGLTTIWNTLTFSTDYSFLSRLPDRFALVSLEVPGEGDANDVVAGRGSSFAVSAPEPATLMLSGLGLASVMARTRQRRNKSGTVNGE